MTTQEIHARRKDLEEQAEAANRSYYPAHQAQAAAESKLRAAKSARTDLLVQESKGLDVDVDAAFQQEGDADMQVEQAKARVNAVARAREEATRHLQEYLAEHFDVFGGEAMKLSARAEQALQKANQSVVRADNIWKEAVSAWRPLVAAKGVAGVPPFPLSGASPIPARPPAVAVESDVAA